MTESLPHGDIGTPVALSSDSFRDHVEALLKRLEAHRATVTRYEEVKEVARGGMGVVVEVRDQDLRRKLALKRMHPQRTLGSDGTPVRQLLARFLQEAQVTGQLGHPGIPPVHELGLDHEGRAYFTMPLISGHTLAQVFEFARAGREGWDVRRTLDVLIRVCEATAFAHARRVVHRDLKPSNVMVGRFGETYVMDWGLARVLDGPDLFDLRIRSEDDVSSVATDRRAALDASGEAPLRTMDDTVLGTPSYMPPEQAMSDVSKMGPRSDVYAVGAMLYHLLSGRAPYQPSVGNLSPRTVLELVQNGPPTPLVEVAPDTDPDLVAICNKAMERDIDRRYASMKELAQDLEAWRDRRPVRASPPALGHALRLFVERHKAATATAVIGLLALAVATVVFVVRVSAEARAKELALVQSQRRGDAMSVRALQTEEGQLWPATPATIPAMKAWLDYVDDISSRAAAAANTHRPASAEGEIGGTELDSILQGVAALRARRPIVAARMEHAETLRRDSIDAPRVEWDEASARVSRSAKYGGLKLVPQLGLVPLGADAKSGFEEFWLVASGPRPDRSRPAIEDEQSGIVLVMLPGGVFTMGSPMPKPPALESPHEERLEPFFLSKYEVTQSQWSRVMETNPSRARAGVYEEEEANERFPVEGVNWRDSQKFCARLGLELPTQAQWEYAARGGLFEDYGYGQSIMDLKDHENVNDQSRTPESPAAWSDGHKLTARVGSFEANGFGLHDMLGNVAEWCRDEFHSSDPVAIGQPEDGTRAFRGGSFAVPTRATRPALVQWDGPTGANHTRGLRPMRTLEGQP